MEDNPIRNVVKIRRRGWVMYALTHSPCANRNADRIKTTVSSNEWVASSNWATSIALLAYAWPPSTSAPEAINGVGNNNGCRCWSLLLFLSASSCSCSSDASPPRITTGTNSPVLACWTQAMFAPTIKSRKNEKWCFQRSYIYTNEIYTFTIEFWQCSFVQCC